MSILYDDSNSEGHDGAVNRGLFPAGWGDGMWCSGWMKFDQIPSVAGADMQPICVGATTAGFSTGHRCQISIASTSDALLNLVKGPTTTRAVETVNTVSVDTWHHFYAWNDSGNGRVVLDGDTGNEGTVTGTPGFPAYDQVTLGYMDFFVAGGLNFFSGQICEVAWGVGPDDDERVALLAEASPVFLREDGGRGYWPMDPDLQALKDEWGKNHLFPKNTPEIGGDRPDILVPAKRFFFDTATIAAILGDVGIDVSPAAVMLEGRGIAGDVGIDVSPVASMLEGRSIAGAVDIDIGIAALMAFSSGNEILGDVGIDVSPAAVMLEGRGIVGAVDIDVSVAAVLSAVFGGEILGDVGIDVSPAAVMLEGRGIAGDVGIDVSPVASMLEGRSIAGNVAVDILVSALMQLGGLPLPETHIYGRLLARPNLTGRNMSRVNLTGKR